MRTARLIRWAIYYPNTPQKLGCKWRSVRKRKRLDRLSPYRMYGMLCESNDCGPKLEKEIDCSSSKLIRRCLWQQFNNSSYRREHIHLSQPIPTIMRIHTITSILLAASSLSLAQTQANNDTENAANHWCGKWAGSPNPADVPTAQQLPPSDYIRRFFVEPQLQRTPFAPIVATEPKVQIPKIWGNSMFSIRDSFLHEDYGV